MFDRISQSVDQMTTLWKRDACEVEGVAWHGLQWVESQDWGDWHTWRGEMMLEQLNSEVRMQRMLTCCSKLWGKRYCGPVTEDSTLEPGPSNSFMENCRFFFLFGHPPPNSQIHSIKIQRLIFNYGCPTLI